MNNRREHVTQQRVVIGLSGGVDSAVAAAMLLDKGYQVHGVILRTWRLQQPHYDPVARAQAIADSIQIPLMIHDVEAAFYDQIVSPFVESYSTGLTPNPCVFCNPMVKFSSLLQIADTMNIPWVATGHYARVTRDTQGTAHLWQGQAGDKDQTYFLYRLSQRQLQRVILPLGEATSKHEVRDLARCMGIPTAEIEESQDLCFVSGLHYTRLVETLLPHAPRPGPILDEEGRILGYHRGLHRYTVGQRKGLPITTAAKGPLYVLCHDVAHNALVVGPRKRLARQECQVTAVSFIQGDPPDTCFSAMAKIRYRAPMIGVRVTVLSSDRLHVYFDQPQYAVAPGQSLVLYQDGEVLGGGIITRAET